MINRRQLAATAIAFFFLGSSGLAQQPDKANIEGIVIRVGSGAPLAGARVTITREVAAPRGFGRGGFGQPGAEGFPAGPSEVPTLPPGFAGGDFGDPGFGGAFGGRGFEGRGGPAQIEPVMTDDRGRFVFESLDPGSYRLVAEANGFVAQTYGQRQVGGQGTVLKVTAGQALTDIAFRLQPTGNISGRIQDQNHRPLTGVSVQLLRAAYDPQGHQTLQPAGGARTNDRGEYRLFWITPGRYYLQAGNSANDAQVMALALGVPPWLNAGGMVNPNEVPEEAQLAFFPGGKEFSGARAIELGPGTELTGVDWELPALPPTYRVRARIVDSRTGKAPTGAEAYIFPVTTGPSTFNPYAGLGDALGSAYNPGKGIAEFKGVAPGTYSIMAVTYGNEAMPFPPDFDPTQGGRPFPGGVEGGVVGGTFGGIVDGPGRFGVPMILTGSVTVAVSDSDVDDIVLTLAAGGTIHGQIRLEGERPAAPAGPTGPGFRGRPRSFMNVQLVPTQTGTAQEVVGGGGAGSVMGTNGDGPFQIDGVTPGEYRITVQPLPATAFIKEARFDGVDVLESPLVLRGAAAGTLDILVSFNGGQIRGTLVDDQAAPVPVTQVVLIPDRARGRAELYKTVSTDANGRFTMTGIPPGSYKVFAWEAIEPYAWFDATLLERFESKGTPVSVAESATENIEVKIISQGSAQ